MSSGVDSQPLPASTDALAAPVGSPPPLVDDAAAAPETTPASAPETPRGRSLRHAHRARLYIYAIVAVALAAVVVALAASNTAHAKVSWVIGSSHVSLVWMVLAAVVLGWLLGILTAAALHRRTRAPH
jgi:uncharacterized integral membrane protein